MVRTRRAYDRVKRLLDLVGATVLFALTLPLQAVVAVVVLLRLGRPVLFRQERPGLHGTTFHLVKFRSMRPVDESRGLLSDAQRLTRFGRLLRSTSLDELPTLWNVIRGDMSIVGPRPLLVEYLSRYSAAQARRHEVRPGVTGLAQVNGRNLVPWDERLALDVRYVDERSFSMDARILLRTLALVLRRRGVSAEGHATVEPFVGARQQDDLT
jgi:lipopolysaccharide/colanic/teichoic acid biosynthesis glycosyltransferase